MKKHISKKINTIVLSTGVVIFSLAAAFSGTIAWFNTTKSQTINAGEFKVVNNTVSIGSITLCKFSYYKEGQYVDYLHPARGSVGTYSYNPSTHQFVDGSGNAQMMNMYDPIEVALGSSLRSLYCNAVYIVTISSSAHSSVDLEVYANHIVKAKTKDSDIYLSDCLDFDVYTPTDLENVTGKAYYPSHITNPEDVTLTGYDEIFYKIGYLSSLEGSHANFYSANPKPDQIPIHDENNLKTLTFSENTTTFYLNVNYSPVQLEQYEQSLAGNDRTAIFDYYFSIDM